MPFNNEHILVFSVRCFIEYESSENNLFFVISMTKWVRLHKARSKKAEYIVSIQIKFAHNGRKLLNWVSMMFYAEYNTGIVHILLITAIINDNWFIMLLIQRLFLLMNIPLLIDRINIFMLEYRRFFSIRCVPIFACFFAGRYGHHIIVVFYPPPSDWHAADI